jgi:hypothetical protein
MDEDIFNKLKEKVGICKDFFPSFLRLPSSYQKLVLMKIKNLVDELSISPAKAKEYDRDFATASKYFPNNSEILESGDSFPFRSARLPKNQENNDVVSINFLSCHLANKLGSAILLSANFSKPAGEFAENKICLVSCSYMSFSSYD